MHNTPMREMSAGIILRAGRVLLVHNTKHGLRIEPPGGKKLAGEGWEESVARELREELGIDVRVGGLFGEYRTHSPEGEFMVRMYYCEIESGEPRVMEPDKVPSFGWYSLDDLKRLCDDGTLVPNMCLAIPEFKRILSSEK
ncbi:MAG TPA: NUDIX hydrolase [Thermodesulfobacteriota bacterium]